jgi:hypothetical protein
VLLTHGNVQLDITNTVAILRQKTDELCLEELPEMSQKMISYQVDNKLKLCLAKSLTDQRDKARLASLGLAHAGDWLNVISHPFSYPGLAC